MKPLITLVAAASMAVAGLLGTSPSGAAALNDTFESNVVKRVNDQRAADVSLSACADGLAEDWAARLAQTKVLVHRDMSVILDQCGASEAGELLALVPKGRTALQVVRQWMSSPTHKATLQDPAYTHVGVGAVTTDDGRRVVVVDFLRPEPTQTPATAPPPSDGIEPRVGVRVFPQYTSATYGHHAAVLDVLGRLGVDRVSGLLTPGMTADEIAFYQEANSRYGIKVWFAIGKPGVTLTADQWTRVRSLLSGPLAGIADVASGWNEPNHRVGGDWSTPTAAHQSALWSNVQQVNADTGQSIKVGTPPLWSGNIDQQFTDLGLLAPKIQGKYDLVNWHMYPHGNKGAELAAMVDRQVTEFTAAYGSHPMLNSESGYFTAQSYSGGSNPSTYESQAAEIDDLVNLHLERGVDISYFELLDDPDPADSNREANFGLVETPDLSPATWFDKPAFAVFQTLTG